MIVDDDDAWRLYWLHFTSLSPTSSATSPVRPPSAGKMAFPPPQELSSTSLPLPDPEAYPGEPREYARALMQRKDEIEREVVSLTIGVQGLRCIDV